MTEIVDTVPAVTQALRNRLLSYGGASTFSDPSYPETFIKDLDENGELFIPHIHLVSKNSFKVDFSAVKDDLPDPVYCGVQLLYGVQHECYESAINYHLETGAELLIGFGLVNNVWIPHSACFQLENNTLVETVWKRPGRLYFMVRGTWSVV